MVDAIISHLLQQLTTMAAEETKEQVRLVTGVGKEVKKLSRNLQAIQAVLHDAEKRQVKEESVRLWLDQLRDVSYNMEDVLEEWSTARLKLKIDGVDDHENAALDPNKKKRMVNRGGDSAGIYICNGANNSAILIFQPKRNYEMASQSRNWGRAGRVLF
ncbi:hypothetical protein KPL70_015382 [Citrus sinensis]|nr:hypothetical protein KPL70_015382 [Citrus sinensis]